MKTIDMKCVKCGKTIRVEDDRDFCFCSYCGSRIDIIADKPRNSIGSNDQANEIRLKELEIEKEKMETDEGEGGNTEGEEVIGRCEI